MNYLQANIVCPVLLVVIVPQIVPSKYVSTALGIHKSVSLSDKITAEF
jgi:general stress protein CsbA